MIPIVSWHELATQDLPISTLERKIGIDENITDFDLETINRLVTHSSPETIFEIGTFSGRTTLNMAVNSPSDAQLYTLGFPPRGNDVALKTANNRSF